MLSFGAKNKSSMLVAYVSGKGKNGDEGVYLTERCASRTKINDKTNTISFNKSFQKKKEIEDAKELKDFLKGSRKSKSKSKGSDSDSDSSDEDSDEESLEENERVGELLTDDWFKLNNIRNVRTKETIRNSVRHRLPVKKELTDLFIKAIKHYNDNFSQSVSIEDGLMEVVPLRVKNMTDSLYITGASGSGKSSVTGTYLSNYKEMFPDNPIYLFSRVATDKVLDQYNPIRIMLDVTILQNPITPEQLSNQDPKTRKYLGSLVIFDDIDTIEVVKIRKEVQALRSLLLETRRHFLIYMVSTSHQLFNYASTRLLISEATALVCFPKKSSLAQLQRYFKEVLGYSLIESRKFLNTDSRWIYVHAQSPRFIVSESTVFLI